MKTLLFALLFSGICFSQNIKEVHTVTAEATAIVPFGSLANKFNYAQSYGVWFKGKDRSNVYASIGISLLIVDKGKDIPYKYRDSIHSIKSENYGIDLGARFTKKKQISERNLVEFSGTFAFHYLSYEFPNRDEDEEENNNPWEFKNTIFLFAPEISYVHKNMGIKLQYCYTPYSLMENFEPKFGSHAVAFGLVYKQ